MGDRTDLFSACQRYVMSKPDGKMTPDLFGDYFEQVQVSTVCKIVL